MTKLHLVTFTAALLLSTTSGAQQTTGPEGNPPPAPPLAAVPNPALVPAEATDILRQTVPMPLGEVVEDCVEDKFIQFYILNLSRFGAPEERRDTVIQYDPARGTVHVAMYGSAKTTDDAKKRLESRKQGLDYAVKLCAQELGQPTKALYGQFEMTYTLVDREAGKRTPLIRWHRGRWELL